MPTPTASVIVKIGALMESTVGSVFGRTTAGVRKIGDTMKELSSRSQELKQLDTASTRAGQNIGTLTERLAKQQATVTRGELALEKLRTRIQETGDADGTLTARLAASSEALERSKTRLAATNAGLETARRDFTESSAAAEKFRAANQHVEGSLIRLGSVMKRYEAASAALQKNQEQRGQWRAAMAEVFVVGAVFKRALDRAGLDEEAKIRLGFVLRGDKKQIGDEIRKMREFARHSTATMPEMLESTSILSRQGFGAETARQLAETAHKMAVVTKQEASETAGTIGVVFNLAQDRMAGTTIEKAQRIGSLLTEMQQRFLFKGGVGEVESAFATLLPLAQRLNMSLSDTGALIGTLSRGDQDPAAVNLVLRNMAKASRTLGFQIQHDAHGNMDFAKTVTAMEEAVIRAHGTFREGGEAIDQAFGGRAAKTITFLVNNVKELNSQQKNLAQGTNQLDQQYKLVAASWGEQWEMASNNIAAAFTPIGKALLPGATAALVKIGNALAKFGEFMTKHPTLGKWIGAIAAGLFGLTAAAVSLGYAFTSLAVPYLTVTKLLALWRLRSEAATAQLVLQAGAADTVAVSTGALATAETDEAVAGGVARAGWLRSIGVLGKLATALDTATLAASPLMAAMGIGLLGAATGGAIAWKQQKDFQAATKERMARWDATHLDLGRKLPLPGDVLKKIGPIGGLKIELVPTAPRVPGPAAGSQRITLPHLAEGGRVTAPTVALLGEAGPEDVVPLNSRDGVAGTFSFSITAPITVYAAQGQSEQAIAKQVRRELEKVIRESEARRRAGARD